MATSQITTIEKNGHIVKLEKGILFQEKPNKIEVINKNFGKVNIYFKQNLVEVYVKHSDAANNSFLCENVKNINVEFTYDDVNLSFGQKTTVFVNERKAIATETLQVFLRVRNPEDHDYIEKKRYFLRDRVNPTKKTIIDNKCDLDNIFERFDADISMKEAFDVL